MSPRSGWFRKLGWLVCRRRKEEELGEEIGFHLEEEAELRRDRGASEEQARWDAGVVLVVTLAASYFPARRASRVDPMVALRYE